jgi:hypothetical protein
VAWFVYMGAFVAYIGLKIPSGLSLDAHARAVGVAVCISLIAVFWLARVHIFSPAAMMKPLRARRLPSGNNQIIFLRNLS